MEQERCRLRFGVYMSLEFLMLLTMLMRLISLVIRLQWPYQLVYSASRVRFNAIAHSYAKSRLS